MEANINPVPDGARFLDVNPQNADPRTPTAPSRRSSCGRTSGYQAITIRSHFGTAHYNSLQVQLNRRYIQGLQFAVAYTLAKTVSDGTTYRRRCVAGRGRWNVGPDSSTQFHNLIVSYTWDLPNGSTAVEQRP